MGQTLKTATQLFKRLQSASTYSLMEGRMDERCITRDWTTSIDFHPQRVRGRSGGWQSSAVRELMDGMRAITPRVQPFLVFSRRFRKFSYEVVFKSKSSHFFSFQRALARLFLWTGEAEKRMCALRWCNLVLRFVGHCLGFSFLRGWQRPWFWEQHIWWGDDTTSWLRTR